MSVRFAWLSVPAVCINNIFHLSNAVKVGWFACYPGCLNGWVVWLFGSTDNCSKAVRYAPATRIWSIRYCNNTFLFFLWVVCSNLRNRYHLRLISCSCIRVCIKMQLEINFVFQIFSRPNACVIITVSLERFSRTSRFKCRGIVNVYVMRYELWTRVEREVRFWMDPHLNIVKN